MNQETTTTSTLYPISSSDQNVNKVENKDHQESKAKPKRYGLVSFWELPEYMKDNEYVLHYYRANWPIKEALFSIFRWHNETLNVWTYVLLNYDNFFFNFSFYCFSFLIYSLTCLASWLFTFRHLIGFIIFVALAVANLMELPQVAGLVSFFTRLGQIFFFFWVIFSL